MRAALTKDRDMARSILPSKGRRYARYAKAQVTRAHRTGVRQALRGARSLVDLDEWDLDDDLTRDTSSEIRGVVLRRRRSDKLNHFERWAVRVTRDLRPQDRLPAMAARLPRGLVGDHAMSHLRRLPELNPWYHHGHWHAAWLRRRAEAHRAELRERQQLEHVVRLLLETPGGHKALNTAMKQLVQDSDDPPHLLHDGRGVAAFVAGLYFSPPRHRYGQGPVPGLVVRRRAAVRALADELDPAWRARPP